MPYSRPSLTALQGLVAGDIAGEVGGADALLRFSNLGVTARAQAGLANLHYGYLDWISKQAVPFTCTDEFLEGWAAIKKVFRSPATSATGTVTFNGAEGSVIPEGAGIVRSDGVAFTTTADGIVGNDGQVTVPAVADADPAGLAGAFGNTAPGVTMTLSQAISGVQSGGVVATAMAGGADIEINDSLRSRMLTAYQQPPQGGGANDYENWALDAPGVTRAWCAPNGFGVGTVVVYFMMDQLRAGGGGFPSGTDGVAATEPRGVTATGDQLTVANHLQTAQAAIGLVYAVAPKPHTVDLAIAGLPVALQSDVMSAIAGLLSAQGEPGVTIPFGAVWSAIAGVAAGWYFTATPAVDIVCPTGYLPVPGNVTFSGGQA